MKTTLSLKWILIACAAALVSCAAPVKTQKVLTSTSLSPDNSIAGSVYREVNSYRREHGMEDLERHAGLDQMAQEHCQYLMEHRGEFNLYGKNVSHYGFEARAFAARKRFNAETCSENVASTGFRGKATGAHLTEMWAHSKSHEFAMREKWTHTGVGAIVDKDGTVFCTQIFALITYPQMIHRNAFTEF